LDVTVGLFVALVLSACKTGSVTTPGADHASVDAHSPLKQIGPAMFEIGRVKFDKNAKTVSFPAAVNQTSGVIEYFLVTTEGKTHESLLRTDVRPHQIHLAMLLLGATGTTNSFPEDPAMPLPGDAVRIEIAWKRKGKRTTRRAEELIFNTKTQSAMSRGNWVFNGSMVIDGTFVAEEQGSIISVIEDPYALVNNPRPGRESDEIWEVLSRQVPPQETEVEVTMCLDGTVEQRAP
jgi:hypothetical protein